MGNEITSVQQYNSVGAKLLAKYGKDANGDKEIDVNEAEGSLPIGKFREVSGAGKDNPATISYLDVMTYEGYKISKAILARIIVCGIVPEMVDISDKLSIMKGEVTVGLFKQVMQQGYEIKGDNADELKAVLNDPSKEGDDLIYVSLLDAREFARRLSEQTGRKFRVPTEAEWEAAKKLVYGQLSGKGWTWTETEIRAGSGLYVLRHLDDVNRYNGYPEDRSDGSAVRLVEDK